MTALRRKAKLRDSPMAPLDLNVICDQCNKSRVHGNHTKCSKQRQAGNGGAAGCRGRPVILIGLGAWFLLSCIAGSLYGRRISQSTAVPLKR